MATFLPTDSIANTTNFLLRLEEARYNIQHVFRDLMEKVQQREAALLEQLEEIKSEYELNNQQIQGAIKALKSQRDFTSQNLKLNQFKELQQQQVEQLNQMISTLEMEAGEEKHISFSWNSHLIEAISAIGKLEVITAVRLQKPIAVDYKQKVKPVISKCRHGSDDGDLKYPWGVAIDMNTGNIYITDRGNDSANVYTANVDFLFKFGIAEKLLNPRNICIYKEKLYLSHNHGVMIFNVNGHLLYKFGTEGSNNDQFKFPSGIAISLNSDIYICDRNNHRVQIYHSKEITYKSTLGKDSLKSPRDIKFAQDELYILTEQDPCLHVYTTEHIYMRSIICNGPDKQIDVALCFHIDNNCNILITDYARHCLYIFTNKGELLHQIGGGESSDMYQPKGVTIDEDGRIIVVNNKHEAKLLMY